MNHTAKMGTNFTSIRIYCRMRSPSFTEYVRLTDRSDLQDMHKMEERYTPNASTIYYSVFPCHRQL